MSKEIRATVCLDCGDPQRHIHEKRCNCGGDRIQMNLTEDEYNKRHIESMRMRAKGTPEEEIMNQIIDAVERKIMDINSRERVDLI